MQPSSSDRHCSASTVSWAFSEKNYASVNFAVEWKKKRKKVCVNCFGYFFSPTVELSLVSVSTSRR